MKAPVAYNLRFPGQVFDGQAGLHYNYFRDYDPGTGRYVESDPIGLRGGINTYAYAKDTPISSADLSGLFSLNIDFSWYTVDNIPGNAWWRRRIPIIGGGYRLGYTDPHLSPASCTCKGCGGKWSLVGCSAALDVNIFIMRGLNAVADPWTRKNEDEHQSDLQQGAGSVYQAGAAAERAQRGIPFSSQATCESESAKAVDAAINAAMKAVVDKSRIRDDNGSHTWPAFISPF